MSSGRLEWCRYLPCELLPLDSNPFSMPVASDLAPRPFAASLSPEAPPSLRDTPPSRGLDRLPLAVLTLAVLLLGATDAAAQDWPTTDWIVTCEPDLRAELNPEDCDDRGVTGPAAVSHYELEQASRWLEALGFKAPDVETFSRVYRARLSDERNEESYGVYYPDAKRLYLNSTFYFALGRGETEEEAERALATAGPSTATMVHELFHAVEHSYHQGETYADPTRDWIWEGMADAVMLAWLRKQQPDKPMRGGVRAFDHPLHQPRDTSDRYETSYFWMTVGEDLNSSDYVQYLDHLLRQDLGPHEGLAGVHEGLKRWEPRGLYEIYPAFIARNVKLPLFFEEVGETTLTYRSPRAGATVSGRVRPVAASAHRIIAEVPEGETAALTVRFAEDHPDLHLIVGGQRLDRENVSASERNVFRTVLAGGAGPDTFFVRVANVAEDAPASRERTYALQLELEPADPCSPAVMGAAVNRDFILPVQGGFWGEAGQELGFQTGQSTLRLSGLVSDGGQACANPLATTYEPSPVADPLDEREAEEAAQQFKDFADRMAREVFGKSSMEEVTDADVENMTPEQERRMGELMNPNYEGPSPEAWREQTGDVVVPVFSPHTASWTAGGLLVPTGTRHGGLAGWRPNAAALVNLHLRGTSAAELAEGRSYPAVALAAGDPDAETWDPDPTNRSAMTPFVFYTRWEGTWIEDCGDTSEELRQLGQQLARQVDPEGEWLDRDDFMEPGCLVNGTSQVLYGSLSGTVTVEEITGAEVRGTFRLSGPATLQLHTLDGQGEIVQEHAESGPVTIEGRFSTPTEERPVPSDS